MQIGNEPAIGRPKGVSEIAIRVPLRDDLTPMHQTMQKMHGVPIPVP